MKLSLVITTYNRTDMVLEAFEKVYDHPLIDEIVIVDDASNEEKYTELLLILSKFQQGKREWKIRTFVNDTNLGMSKNKMTAISKAKNEWVAIVDSDNILSYEYFDSIVDNLCLGSKVIYHPDFAEPEHDYRGYDGFIISSENAKHFLKDREFRVLLNSCNYIVNRGEYLRVYKYDPSIKESDTVYFNTLWLEAGNGFYVVPGMKYHHRKHSGSGWLNGDHRYNMNKAAELQEKIKNL